MTTYYDPNPATPVRPRKRSWVRRTILPAAALFVGIGMGAASAGGGSSDPAAAPAPTPAPTVTQTVEVPGPVETKEVKVPGPTVTKNVTPPVCKVALDYADEGFTTFGEILTAIQAGIASGDFSEADAGNKKVAELAPKYNAAKAACRLSAGAGA